ncbi:MAG: methionyl-tRNA formyltransferase [candidate division Zixibacteria bacterium]|nr:methionyl-tRNA formyltransferase [candidate division Zixibacteria bacterium]
MHSRSSGKSKDVMRIVFMGTPEFALPSLELLLKSEHQVVGVVTQPDKPKGRGLKLSASPVKEFAIKHNLKVLTPEDLKSEEFYQTLSELKPDLTVVVAFRILPERVFGLPPYGTINLHASLLPKYRGAAPINWAIIKGEKRTGVTTFFIQRKVDTGNIILQKEVEISPEETCGELSLKLSKIGAEVLLETINLIEKKEAKTQPQNELEATPAPKITDELCKIDWSRPVEEVNNLTRGVSPTPGAFTFFRGKLLKIYKAEIVTGQEGSTEPGRIISADKSTGILVQAGRGILKLKELQLEGKKKITADEFLRGYRIEAGEKLG